MMCDNGIGGRTHLVNPAQAHERVHQSLDVPLKQLPLAFGVGLHQPDNI
jgi:hypothetical protein